MNVNRIYLIRLAIREAERLLVAAIEQTKASPIRRRASIMENYKK